jgi:ATP-dependent Clp protease ATP-binding subunit ClpA
MFERFTDRARQVVVRAQEEARSLQHGYLGTEHLLLGLRADDTGLAARVLTRLGFDAGEARSAVVEIVGRGPEGPAPENDAEALSAIGIDLEEIRRRVEEAFGPGALDRIPVTRRPRFRRRCEGLWVGHIPFTPRAKKALELSLREARHLGHDYIGAEHLLLGLLREKEGVACVVLASQGVSYQRARGAILEELRRGEGMSPPAPGA